VNSGIANVTDFQAGVPRHLLLDGEIPLPGVGSDTFGIFPVVGRDRSAGQRGHSIQGAIAVDADDKGRRARHAFIDAHQFPLEELSTTSTNSSLAVAINVPGNAQSGRNVMVVLVDEGAVLAGRPAG